MGNTNIEYADEVSNPLQVRDLQTGKKGTHCEKPDPEGTCKNCWAEVLNTRGKPDNQRFGTGLTFHKINRDRVEWFRHDKEMARLSRLNARKPMSEKFPGNPLIVFTNDTYDLFQPSISDELRDWVFGNYDQFADLTLLVQTTYVSRMSTYLQKRYPDGMPPQYVIGMSAGTQKFLDDNAPHLLRVPAKRLYVIFEPLLENISWRWQPYSHLATGERYRQYLERTGSTNEYEALRKMALLIIGGESGTDARPCDIAWIHSLATDGKAAGISVLVKQLGTNPTAMTRMSGHAEGSWAINADGSLRLKLKNRKGGDMSEWPEDLRIREFPQLTI